MASFVAIYGTLMLLTAGAAGVIAYVKRRDVSYWMTVCFLFPPAILMLLLMQKNTGPRRKRESLEDQEDREYAHDGSDRFI